MESIALTDTVFGEEKAHACENAANANHVQLTYCEAFYQEAAMNRRRFLNAIGVAPAAVFVPSIVLSEPERNPAALTFARATEKAGSFILTADEGDVIGNHHIKADPKTGSIRLGVGLQHFAGGNGIPLHMHEKE